jgi:hypothetical protein
LSDDFVVDAVDVLMPVNTKGAVASRSYSGIKARLVNLGHRLVERHCNEALQRGSATRSQLIYVSMPFWPSRF